VQTGERKWRFGPCHLPGEAAPHMVPDGVRGADNMVDPHLRSRIICSAGEPGIQRHRSMTSAGWRQPTRFVTALIPTTAGLLALSVHPTEAGTHLP
jgi:hypothetical protein